MAEQQLSCDEGTPRGRFQLAWHGHQPTNLPPGRRVLRSVQVAHCTILRKKSEYFTRGVVDEWGESVTHLSSGPCLALQVSTSTQPQIWTHFQHQLGGEGDLVERLRELCGPPDPAVAKLIRPKSLRARFEDGKKHQLPWNPIHFRFGESLVKNGVHCTDLPEDASLEVNYFFSVLQ